MAVCPEVCEMVAENIITVTPSLNMAKEKSPVPEDDQVFLRLMMWIVDYGKR